MIKQIIISIIGGIIGAAIGILLVSGAYHLAKCRNKVITVPYTVGEYRITAEVTN